MLRAGRGASPVGVLLSGPRLWSAVAALSLDQLVAWGILYYAYTVLSAPMAADLGISRLEVAAAFSGCLLVAGWLGRAIGPALDERGTAALMRAGALAGPLIFAALAAVDGSAGLALVFALLGAVQAVALYEPAFRTLVDWCPPERQRTRAMLLLTSIGGFASTVFLPVTHWLVELHGWRVAVVLLAGVLALVLIPVRFALPLPHRGRSAAPPAPIGAPRSATLLAAGLSLHALASTGAFITMMWFLVERGETSTGAAALAGFAGAAQVPGRLVAAPLRRALGDRSILALLLAVQAVALLGAIALGAWPSLALIMVFGAASGMMTLERTTVLVEWYGRVSFGAHQGRLSAATSTARAASPFLVEAGHHVMPYSVVFALLGVALVFAAWACTTAARAHATEIMNQR